MKFAPAPTGRTTCHVGGQPLQQGIPRHDFDVDLDVGVGCLERSGDLLEIGAGLGAVFGNGEVNDRLRRCRRGEGIHAQAKRHYRSGSPKRIGHKVSLLLYLSYAREVTGWLRAANFGNAILGRVQKKLKLN